jgi:hypothetical protein
MRFKNALQTLGEWAVAIGVMAIMLIVLVVMLFFEILPFRSESVQRDIAEYKTISDQKQCDGPPLRITAPPKARASTSHQPGTLSGTTVAVITTTELMKNFQKLRS